MYHAKLNKHILYCARADVLVGTEIKSELKTTPNYFECEYPLKI